MSSELFNLFKLVNGGRRDEPNNNGLIDPVELSHLASTIESKGIYGFDDYGRFRKASESECAKCLEALAEYGRSRFTHILVDSYLESVSGPNAKREWHLFGWLSDDLPDFVQNHAEWIESHGIAQEVKIPQTSQKNIRIDSTEYLILAGYLKTNLTEELQS